MSAFDEQPVVGLFGTCGSSTFRKNLFIPAYEKQHVPYFNPQVDDWRPELADIESDHLAHDVVQCWPVLGSTYGTGSLAEQGYSIASSLRAPTPLPKFVVAMIEMELDDSLDDEVARKESIRARKLAATHLANNASPNVYVVESLEEMLDLSITLYAAAESLTAVVRASNPAYMRYAAERARAKEFERAMLSCEVGVTEMK
jgi:hypothetical protein